MPEFGRQADLARMLGVTPAAISEAFKRHNIQIEKDANGKFNLGYAEYLLKKKQNEKASKAQRSAKKQPAGLKNPQLKREIIRLTWPVWERAIKEVITARFEVSFTTERDVIDMENYLFCLSALWHAYHRIIEAEIPAGVGDFPFNQPGCLKWDCMNTTVPEQITKILGMEGDPQETNYENLVVNAGPLAEALDQARADVPGEPANLGSGGANFPSPPPGKAASDE